MKSRQKIDVAAYYWPAHHDETRWRAFMKEGEGEWEIIRKARPKFAGHNMPRVPLWGYEDETKPSVMAKKIEAASSHGVNTLIFDWYWYEDQPFLEECLTEGFLKAPNCQTIQFFLMWANHNATTLWDLDRSHRNEVIWPGSVDRNVFDKIVDRVISRYFVQPNYYRINGAPVFSIYELSTLIEGLGGLENTKEALASFRNKVKAAGFPDLHLQGILWDLIPASVSSVPGDRVPTQEKTVAELGINSLTNYQWIHYVPPVASYVAWGKAACAKWVDWSTQFSVPYYPHVAVGWDTNARFKDSLSPLVHEEVGPAQFRRFLEQAKAFAQRGPEGHRMITINSWNEWSEGSYLEPDTRNGMGYLDAVREVFLE